MSTILRRIGHSGLFDTGFYLLRNPDLRDIGSGALYHYHNTGWKEGRKPNPFFDPNWYLEKNRDVTGDPLFHYLSHGEYEGRYPVPWFDPVWYRQANNVPANTIALAHYLANRHQDHIRPMPFFDPAFYLSSYPDVAASGMDPVEHYMLQGFREVRRPFPGFDPVFYRTRYLGDRPELNPFLHWLDHREQTGFYPALPHHEATVPREVRRRSQPGPFFEERHPLPEAALRRARLLAYYLPQYHSIPENDSWWGTGFTEWTNLCRALPRFVDHYQPRIPRDLGHYCLKSVDIISRQMILAKQAGIEGFIFYHYWFDGRRLLQSPVEALLQSPTVSVPFCLMWANENWSRRWDGSDEDILIAQHYCEKDDPDLIADLARHMRDPRYIQVLGRPLFFIYRPGSIPESRSRILKWRILFREQQGLDPIMVMAQAFRDHDPGLYGLDGAVEFPPHKITEECSPIEDRLVRLDPDMTARVYDYAEVVEKSLAEPMPDFPLIRTASPSWDNDARRQGAGLVLHGSTPRLYERWLSGLIKQARQTPFYGEAIVCINAWNEWTEGAYLEPDLHFGSAYLNATARAATGFEATRSTRRSVLLVGHDAFPAGAQMLLLAIATALKRNHGVNIAFVLLGGGILLDRYRAVGSVEIVSPGTTASLKRLIALKNEGYSAVLVNSAASAGIGPDLHQAGLPYTLLIHEMSGMIRRQGIADVLPQTVHDAKRVVVPGAMISRDYPGSVILPQGLYRPITFSDKERRRVRQTYSIGPGVQLVIGVGHGDTRKGFDLFLQLWQLTQTRLFKEMPRRDRHAGFQFMWVGSVAESLAEALADDIARAKASHQVHLIDRVDDVAPFLSAADVFVLTSREDPYPSVVLEALASGLPCCVFEKAGIIPDLLEDLREQGDCRHGAVPIGDLVAMAEWLRESRPTTRNRTLSREASGKQLGKRFSFSRYVETLLPMVLEDVPRVSVVVLSYNYARYLAARLATIFSQSLPVLEIIVLDDASSDDSVDLAAETAKAFDRKIRIVANPERSGSVFRQWRRAAELARGNWLWIAEADDLSEPDFLASLISALRRAPKAVMAFCDSRTIDRDGVTLSANYQPYYREHVGHRLARDMLIGGRSFVRECLAHCNLVLNVSSVLFRRQDLFSAMQACLTDLDTLSLAGDWRLYVELLLRPGVEIVYLARPLNIHRRHHSSVTASFDVRRHQKEIATVQDHIAACFDYDCELVAAQERYRAKIAQQFRPLQPRDGRKIPVRSPGGGASAR